jgi:hypothetical protein
MKLTTLAPAALLLLAGGVFAQDAGDAAAGGIADSTETESQLDTGVDSTLEGDTAGADLDASASAHADFATADSDADGKLSVAELQAVMPDVTITDSDADGYVSQSEAEASISGLAFDSGDGSEAIDEADYDTILSALEDDASASETDAGPTVN